MAEDELTVRDSIVSGAAKRMTVHFPEEDGLAFPCRALTRSAPKWIAIPERPIFAKHTTGCMCAWLCYAWFCPIALDRLNRGPILLAHIENDQGVGMASSKGREREKELRRRRKRRKERIKARITEAKTRARN